MHGPQLAFSEALHAHKYRGEGESFREAMNRVASALQDDEEHYKAFREMLLDMRFMPAGRVQSAMGSTRDVTPYNCFVSGTIEDSAVDGHGSIMDRAKEAFATMRKGGGIGYDFSTLRPSGAMIKKLQSQASGPVSFMDIFDAVCKCVSSSGHRRGAQMGVLRVDHPDIEEFIHAKQNSNRLTHFNMSIAVTDEFMEAVRDGKMFPLRWSGEIYKEIDARALWEMIMRSTWDWAEPGVLFIDQINRMNNLYYCETIAATNPCGEQPLPPYGACLLGSFNLVKFISGPGPVPLTAVGHARTFDWDQFDADIAVAVRSMDNIVDRARYPMYEQEKEAKAKRRMGLGVTGLANAIEALGHPYGSAEFLDMEDRILERLCHQAYRASAMLAREKGPFPLYDPQSYLSGAFIQTLPEDIRDLIREHGIRNSHLISIAPTGTISLCADNVSSGIEPVFAYSFDRVVIGPEGSRTETVHDYGHRVLGIDGRRASEVTVQEHLDVLSVAYRYVDSAVAKTCNVPGDVSWADFKQIYMDAWERGCKGCTTFRIDGKREGILSVNEDDGSASEPDVVAKTSTDDGGSACYVDTITGRRECE